MTALHVLDLSGVVHAAWHVAEGAHEPHMRVFGSMLGSILRATLPNHLVCACDSPRNWRREANALYKANRPLKPDGFKDYIEACRELVEEANVLCLSADGYEADDVINSICVLTWARPEIAPLMVISSDHDLWQCVTDAVSICSAKEIQYITPDQVVERYGVRPWQIPHLWAFCGFENIPGVRGIGETLAAALLREHDTAPGVYVCLAQNRPLGVEKLGPKKLEAIRAAKDAVLDPGGSLDLATLRVVPGFVLPELRSLRVNASHLAWLLEELGRMGRMPTRMAEAPEPDGADAGAFKRDDATDHEMDKTVPEPPVDPCPHTAELPSTGTSIPVQQAVAQLEALVASQEAELEAWESQLSEWTAAVVQKRALVAAYKVSLRGAKGLPLYETAASALAGVAP